MLLALMAMTGLVQAQWLNNNEVAFTGMVTDMIVNGNGTGTLFVRMETVDLRVLVNSKTVLRGTDDVPIAMDDFENDYTKPLIEVVGKFSSRGILATLVRVLGEEDESNVFRVRGTIGQLVVSEENIIISLLGMTIVAAPDLAADLSIGTKVEIEGHIVEGEDANDDWIADTIKILSENKRRGSLVFEGTVESYDSDAGLLDVLVAGVPGNVTRVYITQATRVVGELGEGVMVQVSGILDPDMTVRAKEIMVLAALEIKPDEIKLKAGTTGQLTVKLREIPDTDVEVTLISNNLGAVTVPDAVTVAAGNNTANFVVAAVAIGTATITATYGNDSATAFVKVGQQSEDETDPADAEVRVAFASDHIKLGLNESREVVLLIKPPQKETVAVTFEITGDQEDLFTYGAPRTLSNGAANLKVMITAGDVEGSGTLITTLPEDLGGGKAELIVEVGKSKGMK